MADTGTTKLSQRNRLTKFKGDELMPVVTDGKTLAGTTQALAEFVAPIAGEMAPVTEAARAAADAAAASEAAAAASSQTASTAADSAEEHAAISVTNAGVATDAANAAQVAAESLAVTGGAKPYQTVVELNAITPTDPKALAYVTNDSTPANNGLYSWNGAAWVKSAYDPLTDSKKYTDAEAQRRAALIASNMIDIIVDKFGFAVLGFLADRFKAYVPFDAAQLIASNNRVLVLDKNGFGYDLIASLQQLDTLASQITPRTVVDVSQPMITPKIAFWADKQLSLDVSSMMKDRASQSLNQYVLASFVSQYAECCVDASRTLTLPPTKAINGSAYLFLRDKIDQRARSRTPISIVSAPDAVGTETIKFHCIGDSIVEMDGAPLAKRMISDHGYTVNMIGTYQSGTVSYKGGALGAELCEGRGGWMAMDLTHRDATHPPITSVADYNALSNTDKKNYNPYIRAATDSDNPADVNNGYIFDFADYLAKFGFAQPDVVYLGMGTNDINKRSFSEFAANFPLDIATLVRQIKAGAPAAKIILGLPSTAMTTQRNARWSTYYFTGIRALISAAATFGVGIAPTWLAFSGESEYLWTTTSTDAVTGTQAGYYTETDMLHPYDGSRFALYDMISATLVAAFKGLI
ncbi:SGNH/GDSL hydrolase family protein [Burkholderia multivorans]|uniref:SGNH/GDSL hydrolase family protein n=1 Tax=Burkholderia multivorans TaxID=87883 RepID=UPI0011B9433E|nr:SGNH/GDSL hydrolase family protein [Burkholderia multivorans]